MQNNKAEQIPEYSRGTPSLNSVMVACIRGLSENTSEELRTKMSKMVCKNGYLNITYAVWYSMK